jgi:hypothetical protein
MPQGARFCLIWLGAVLVTLACVGVFDIAVDPYDIFAVPRVPGFNARKPDAATHQMMTKTYAAYRARPVTLLLGSSRVDVGIDAGSDAFPPAMRPVFNFGIGGQVYEGDLFALRQALAGGRLHYAVLVVDFELALKDQPVLLQEQLDRAADAQGRMWQQARDMFLASLTLGAFLDSVGTVLAQHDPGAPDMAEDGSSSDAELAAHTASDGSAALFAEKDRGDEARNARGAAYLAAHPGAVPSLDGVARIAGFCRDHGVELTLVVPPMHARALAQWRRYGLWPRFQVWRAGLAAIAGDGVALWDFSADSPFISETPVAGRDPRWFWESLHFKRVLGDMMLRRMFDADATPFGVAVSRSR